MTRLNIKIYRNLMGANDLWAERTRALLKKHHVVMLNLIGSPRVEGPANKWRRASSRPTSEPPRAEGPATAGGC